MSSATTEKAVDYLVSQKTSVEMYHQCPYYMWLFGHQCPFNYGGYLNTQCPFNYGGYLDINVRSYLVRTKVLKFSY
ncbi:unnamed protein product [Rhizophagus irregularis]|nr:unnamed protein product [Rhizophagus irregularis]